MSYVKIQMLERLQGGRIKVDIWGGLFFIVHHPGTRYLFRGIKMHSGEMTTQIGVTCL